MQEVRRIMLEQEYKAHKWTETVAQCNPALQTLEVRPTQSYTLLIGRATNKQMPTYTE